MDQVNLLLGLNTILNMLGLMAAACAALLVVDYRGRVRARHDVLNRRLDHILILTNEMYQDALKQKRLKPKEEDLNLIASVKEHADKVRKEMKDESKMEKP